MKELIETALGCLNEASLNGTPVDTDDMAYEIGNFIDDVYGFGDFEELEDVLADAKDVNAVIKYFEDNWSFNLKKSQFNKIIKYLKKNSKLI